jgi:PTH1 family peptidyl-tRNA hydrolase
MHLVIGLGNPGRRYRGTRHNIGREVVDLVAHRHAIAIDRDEGFATVGRGAIDGRRVCLARLETYMNVSGVAVADLRRRHRVQPQRLLLVVDDLDLLAGTVRMREKGSHGGHNGLRSVIEELGTSDFPRLRLGIGRPPAGVDPADYVLERPTGHERAELDDAVERAAAGVALWVSEGIQAAMRYCNVRAAPATTTGLQAP